MADRQKIAVYSGPGADNHSLKALIESLREALPLFRIEEVSASFFHEDEWEKKSALVVMPGGRDLPYCEALGGACVRIRRFVAEGGAYLGICAGGYFGSSYVEFEKGGPLEVVGPRDLAFFGGKAIGPAYGPGLFEYGSERGARLASLDFSGEPVELYYNGGALFQEPESGSQVEVVARYSDLQARPAAIILARLGKGRALLTGVHPERAFSSEPLEKKRKKVLKQLLEVCLAKK